MKLIRLNHGKFAKVDDHWFKYLSQWTWYFDKTDGLVKRASTKLYEPRAVMMHRVVNRTLEGLLTNHKDGDNLNNQEANLRNATASEIQMNRGKSKCNKKTSSQYKGIHWHIRHQKWHVRIQSKGIQYHLGYYHSEIYAAGVYDNAAVQYHKSFAKLNFPEKVQA